LSTLAHDRAAPIPAGTDGVAALLRRHGRGVVAMATGVVALHAAIVASWTLPEPQPRRARTGAVELRVVPAETHATEVAPAGEHVPQRPPAAPTDPADERSIARANDTRRENDATRTTRPPRAIASRGPPRAAETAQAAEPTPATRSVASSVPAENTGPGEALRDPTPAAPVAEAAFGEPAWAPDALPRYRTHPPPAATLRYAVRHAGGVGAAVLRWEPGEDGYRLSLEMDAGTRGVEASTGGFDEAGLAPLRHTDARARRGSVATNFGREDAVVSFSASSRRLALVPGAQDRLSWLVQLAAILEAGPERRTEGAITLLPVAGSRGEAMVWALRSYGIEEVSTQSGVRTALRLGREPAGLRDLGVDVWLAPELHHLPVRWVLRTPVGGTALEFELLDVTP
jgi:hypothetical protein